MTALYPFWANKGSFDSLKKTLRNEPLFAQKGYNAVTCWLKQSGPFFYFSAPVNRGPPCIGSKVVVVAPGSVAGVSAGSVVTFSLVVVTLDSVVGVSTGSVVGDLITSGVVNSPEPEPDPEASSVTTGGSTLKVVVVVAG